MNITGFSERDLIKKVGAFTEKEIWGQPDLWNEIFEQVLKEKQSILSFLENATNHENLKIILTGAGSSAFIGLSLTGLFNLYFKRNTTDVATTDLVTHPTDYLNSETPLLLISFARSGNSPESVAAVAIADQICSKVFHLIISCDASGALAQYETDSLKYVFVLPAAANDKSLAMTGSYSGMLLAGLLIAKIRQINKLQSQISTLQHYARKLLGRAEEFKQLAELDFERAVFLGSGTLYGTATESHLKLQELTDGKIICKKDSFLGFRHGPKAVINGKTLVFMLFSNKPYVLQYEADLIGSLNEGQKPLFIAGIIESEIIKLKIDKLFVLEKHNLLDEEFLPVCLILPAQLLGYYKCLQLGLDPDLPSASGAISRVVKGVVIYPYINQ
jgi:tagatose-6-phosphate ketose/aldose isomerase